MGRGRDALLPSFKRGFVINHAQRAFSSPWHLLLLTSALQGGWGGGERNLLGVHLPPRLPLHLPHPPPSAPSGSPWLVA